MRNDDNVICTLPCPADTHRDAKIADHTAGKPNRQHYIGGRRSVSMAMDGMDGMTRLAMHSRRIKVGFFFYQGSL
jgi:hypothetical protein